MAILSRSRRDRREEFLPLPPDEEIRHMLDAALGESLAELATAGLPPAVDVQAETAAWEYDKQHRPAIFQRRLALIESRGTAA